MQTHMCLLHTTIANCCPAATVVSFKVLVWLSHCGLYSLLPKLKFFLLMCLSSLVTVFLRVSSNVRIDAANF